jgi:hypothetical protein
MIRQLAYTVILGLLTVAPAGPNASSAVPPQQGSHGLVAYRLNGGDIYELAAGAGAKPLDVSAALDKLSARAADEWLNVSRGGRWLLTSTERFGCGGWACLARVSGSLAKGGALRAPSGVIHTDGFGAISADGRTVVFPQGGATHTRDLWMTRLAGGSWTNPRPITTASPYDHNAQPAISADGRRVLFDCGAGEPGDAGTAACEVSVGGGPVRTVIAPGPHNEAHHAAFAPSGRIVFEADWRGEQIWRLGAGSHRPALVSRVHDDNSPCVLPDGRIVSLYLDRPGNRNGVHEIRVADAGGGRGREILAGRDVLDIGIGCG